MFGLFCQKITRQKMYSIYNILMELTQMQQQVPINPLMPSVKQSKNFNARPVILGIAAAAIVFGTIVVYFYYRNSSSGDMVTPLSDGNTQVNTEAGELSMNPLTGELTPIRADEESVTLRPLAVMVNNHPDARPQSGLVDADLTYEIVAEGGITRFLPFFLGSTPEKIGPVRSTREYYLVLVKELGDAMLMHIGWSPQALEAIESWPVRSLGRGGGTFWRDNPRGVAIEHTAYINGVELRQIAQGLGWEGRRDFDIWKFKDDKKGYDSASPANEITIDFWYKGDFSAIFKYDAATNSYLRFMGYDSADQPIPHVDQETNEQIKVKNVIVQFATENGIAGDDKSRLEYALIGSGNALVFLDGKVVNATWSKSDRDARTKFFDASTGAEIEYNRGKFWISIVPDRNVDQVVYQ